MKQSNIRWTLSLAYQWDARHIYLFIYFIICFMEIFTMLLSLIWYSWRFNNVSSSVQWYNNLNWKKKLRRILRLFAWIIDFASHQIQFGSKIVRHYTYKFLLMTLDTRIAHVFFKLNVRFGSNDRFKVFVFFSSFSFCLLNDLINVDECTRF